MFRYLLIASLLALCLVSCDPKEALDPTNRCLWIVKNSTGEDIWIKSELSVDEFEKYLRVNESKTFDRGGAPKAEAVDFQDFFSVYVNDEKSYLKAVEIYNADKTVLLKKWSISQFNNHGRQFFNEAYWTKKEWKGQGGYEKYGYSDKWYNYHEWTFEILPEDLK